MVESTNGEFQRQQRNPESILESYPYLEKHDIQEALNYAAFLADDQIIEFA